MAGRRRGFAVIHDMTSTSLQLEFRLNGLALHTEAGGFEVLNPLAGNLWCRKCRAFSGTERMPSKEWTDSLWQQVLSDPKRLWGNRQRNRNPRHPDFRHIMSNVAPWLDNRHKPAWVDSQLPTWDSKTTTVPESVFTSIEAQGAFRRYEGHFQVEMWRKLCKDGSINDAVASLNLLVQRGCHVDKEILYLVLKRCIAHKDLIFGRQVHCLTIESGYDGDAFLATHLMGLYASHGRLEEAMGVFTKVCVPDAYNWATIIFAYAKHGEAAQAIRLYRHMRESTSVRPDNRIYVAVLKACATAGDLVAGLEVQSHILAEPGTPDIFVQTGLVHMFAKCGRLQDARTVFDGLPARNVVSWTAMIAAYAQQGLGEEALSLYNDMQQDGLTPPDSVTYVCLLQACASVGVGALAQGKQLHAQIEERGLRYDVLLGGSLVNMYARCGSLEDARKLFDRLPDRNVFIWTTMIAGYAQQGLGQEALRLHSSMQQGGLTPPDAVTYVCLLQACASVGALDQARQLHAQIEERGLQVDEVLGGSLVDTYVKCGSVVAARSVFDKLPNKNVVVWTAMISGYAEQAGMGQEALSLYRDMQNTGLSPPDAVAYVCLLQACACVGVGALDQGKQLHVEIQERGLQYDVVVGGSLVHMYAKCGSVEDSRTVFDRLPVRSVVVWTAMIAGYAQQGRGEEALSLYSSMKQEGIASPSSVTFLCLLQACASAGTGALQQAKLLHAQIEEQGLQDDVVVGGSLVNMYAKCGSLVDARSMFDSLPEKNVVTWSAMIAGYAEQGMGEEALSLYRNMQEEGKTTPNSVTFVCLLQACAIVAALPLGKQLHTEIEERRLQADPGVGAALVNMYAKCGTIFDSQQVFDLLPQKGIEAWGALAAGYSRQGDSEAVFGLLDRMRVEGIQPDGIIFLSVLTVCSHVGLVDKGRAYFEAMSREHGISPSVQHYTCMMDLLGRAGLLDEALEMAKSMPFPASDLVWLTLLGACQKWNNVEIGQQAFEGAVRFDGNLTSSSSSPYVLMSNIYASAEMWEEAEEMQARRVKCGSWKKVPGQSWCRGIGGEVHTFAAVVPEAW